MKTVIGALISALLLTVGATARADTTPAPAKPIPTIDFARKSTFLTAKISPNGEYLAATTMVEDQVALAIIDIKSVKIAASLRFSRGEGVADFWWTKPNRVIVSIAERDGPLDQQRWTGELWAMDADGKNKKYLFGYRGSEGVGSHLGNSTKEFAFAQLVDPMESDPRHALIAVYAWRSAEVWSNPTLYKLDVYTGYKDRVGLAPGYEPLDVAADRSGKARFAYGDDRNSNAHAYRWSDDAGNWVELKCAGAAPSSFSGAVISGDGASAFTVAAYEDGRSCLDEIVLSSGDIRELYCNKTGLAPSAILWSLDGSDRPIGLLHEGPETPELLAPDHPDAKLFRILQNSFQGERIRITSRTTDGAKVIVHTDSDRNPGDFYLLDRATKKAEYLMSTRDWIDPRRMAETKRIDYAARDGQVIHGLLTMPQGVASKAPFVVLPHGGPMGIRDQWEWDAWAQFLASRGYGVLQPNFRGSGGYGYAFQHAADQKWGTLIIDDITDGAKWAVQRGFADPARMCIFGASFGGYAALMSAVREPDLYRCAVGFAGVYDLPSQIADSDIGNSLMGRNYIERSIGTDPKVLREQSPITFVDRLKAAVFLIHGTADPRVPFNQAKKLRKALEQIHKPYEWLEKGGEEHGFSKDENNVEFLDKLAAFLDKNIGSKPAP